MARMQVPAAWTDVGTDTSMVKLALVPARKAHEATPLVGNHRGAPTEGEAVRQILEQAGYPPKKSSKTQFECACPFHEAPGPVPTRKSPNFYVNRDSGLYYCHSASCGEKGNLQTLERFFGLDVSKPEFQGREQRLKEFEAALTPERRQVLYDEGLNDTTIERFRAGWVDEYRLPDGRRMAANAYVFPYLEGRRAVAFRFYDPQCNGPGGSKYWWEEGIGARPYNIGDAVGDKDGRVFICEGEKKAMLLTQLGYAAVGLPGAANFKREWHEAFTHAKKIFVCFDSDNPEYHIYAKCNKCGEGKCTGHNPGQEAAVRLVEQFGWRATNIVLPLPEGQRKVDINEYFVRDGHTAPDFAELALGIRKTPYIVSSLADIEENPPDEAAFIVEHGILPRGGRLLISGAPKTGKMARISTPVLTPTGWSTMGELRPGDRVIGVDGKPTEVIAIHPQGRKDIYKISISDGSSTECGLEHLWSIQSHNDRVAQKRDGRPRWSTITTKEVKFLLDNGNDRHTYLPMVEPVEYDPVGPLPIDAYALGLLLGDGSFRMATPAFSKPDQELHDALAKAFPDLAISPMRSDGNTYISDPSSEGNWLKRQLSDLDLWGRHSYEKFIPEIYLRAPVADRLALLQGLMDTDGNVQFNRIGNSAAWYSTTSEVLKDHVIELVESLGGTTAVTHKKAPKFQDGGVGRPAWAIGVRLPEFEPFRLVRKRDEWLSGRTDTDRPPVRRITNVELVDQDEAVCITVANGDGLYITERFIVTHNSILAEHLALSVASGLPFLHRFGIDEVDGRRVLLLDRELSERALFDRLQEFIAYRPGYKVGRGNLLIDHEHQLRLDLKDSYDPLSQLIEQNGADVIILDTAYKFFQGDMESSSALMKVFDTLDRVIANTGVSVVVTHHQRKKVGGQKRRDADIGDPDNVAGSFLWTGWPNATVLLDFMDRRLNSPFNVVASFTAFRDAAPPDPLGLYREKDSINYSAIQDYQPDQSAPSELHNVRPTEETVGDLLIKLVPTVEDDFLHLAATKFGCRVDTIRPFVVSLIDQGHFTRTNGRPPVLKHADKREETYEEGKGLAASDAQLRLVTEIDPTAMEVQ